MNLVEEKVKTAQGKPCENSTHRVLWDAEKLLWHNSTSSPTQWGAIHCYLTRLLKGPVLDIWKDEKNYKVPYKGTAQFWVTQMKTSAYRCYHKHREKTEGQGMEKFKKKQERQLGGNKAQKGRWLWDFWLRGARSRATWQVLLSRLGPLGRQHPFARNRADLKNSPSRPKGTPLRNRAS